MGKFLPDGHFTLHPFDHVDMNAGMVPKELKTKGQTWTYEGGGATLDGGADTYLRRGRWCCARTARGELVARPSREVRTPTRRWCCVRLLGMWRDLRGKWCCRGWHRDSGGSLAAAHGMVAPAKIARALESARQKRAVAAACTRPDGRCWCLVQLHANFPPHRGRRRGHERRYGRFADTAHAVRRPPQAPFSAVRPVSCDLLRKSAAGGREVHRGGCRV